MVAGLHALLVAPFEPSFMQAGLLAAVVVGAVAATVGTFVIARGQALLADSLAHGVIPGVALGVLAAGGTAAAGSPGVLIGGIAGALVTAGLTALVVGRSGLRDDTAAAVVFVFMLALGVVLISRASNFAVDLTAFLFGDVLGVAPGDLPLLAGAGALTLAATAALYRPLVLVCFDRRRAASLGVPVAAVELAFMVLIAAAVMIGFRAVGALLVLGLLIAPPAAAALVARRPPQMIAIAIAIATVSAPVGLLLSWHLDVAAGAAIVLVAIAACLALIAVRPQRG